MDDLSAIRYDTFRDRVGERFAVPAADIDLVLDTVTDFGAGAGAREAGAFSLLFRGPADTMLLQATHVLRHPDLGELGLFLVPVERTADGYRYEATFN
jgi:hypothetical protein